MEPFFGVFQDFAGSRIDTNFVNNFAALYVEGVAETTAALLFFQLFIGDRAWTSLQGD